MSTNGFNTVEDTDMAECEDGEKVVTMMDVLQEQQEFEDDANAVLGASDDKNCTYSKGYIKRQAIYACLTCCVDAKDDPTKRAGVCLACSLSCHENHELIELYTKRNFRCDCGNPNFNSHPCQFVPDKPDHNKENSYNQNFSGIYCTCHRPYPDPETTFEDEMIQCIICEDWLHASHLETVIPCNEQYAEMICKSCMEMNEFLHDYSDIAVNTDPVEVDVETVNNTDSPVTNGASECNDMVKEKGNEEEETPKEDVMTSKADIVMEDEQKNIESEPPTDKIASKELGDVNMADNMDAEPQKSKLSEEPVSAPTDSVSNEDSCENKDPVETSSSSNDKPSEQTDDSSENKDLAEENNPNIDNLSKPMETNSENKSSSENVEERNVDKESEEPTKTTDENMVKSEESTTQDEKKLETEEQSNENSIIESIEKLESELGNVEPREKTEDKEMENDEQGINENSATLENAGDRADDSMNTSDKLNTNEAESILGDNQEMKEKTVNVEISKPNESQVTPENDINNSKNEDVETDKTCAGEEDSSMPSESENLINNSKNDDDRTENKSSEEDSSMPSEAEAKIREDTKDIKRKLSTEETEDNTSKKVKLDSSGCVRPKGVKRRFKGATFWPSNFRQKLCTCNECISMYKDLAVLFLTDPEDTVAAYEKLGQEKTNGIAASQYEKGLEALSSLDRIQQINALTEYNKMKDKLLVFLKTFKERKEIVTEEDIKAFFAGMKMKREPDGVYFCR